MTGLPPERPLEEQVTQALASVENDLQQGTYRVGGWQRCVASAAGLGLKSKRRLSPDFTRVSNLLHRRNQFLEIPAWLGFAFEYGLLVVSLLCATSDFLIVQIMAMGMLVLCLQPLLKISMGLVLGVRYAYTYLWYFEPRFKMAYGTYLVLPAWKKLVLQFSGSVGTPIALLVGWQVLSAEPAWSLLFLVTAIGAGAMQIAAFIAVMRGVRKIGPFLLANLTTPALLAKEWRDLKRG